MYLTIFYHAREEDHLHLVSTSKEDSKTLSLLPIKELLSTSRHSGELDCLSIMQLILTSTNNRARKTHPNKKVANQR